MRPLAPSDLSVAARALMALPEPARAGAAARIVAEARAADRFRRRTGRWHPLWGDGTLEAAARARPLAPQPVWGDRAHLSCMALVLAALLEPGRPGRGTVP
jgi:hypothetical protein